MKLWTKACPVLAAVLLLFGCVGSPENPVCYKTVRSSSGKDSRALTAKPCQVSNLGPRNGQVVALMRSSVSRILEANIENLTLTGSAAVNGTGNELGNVLTGNAAANLLSGADGPDQLFGLGGNDRLDGGAGTDEMSGGAGNDVFVLRVGETEGDSILDFLETVPASATLCTSRDSGPAPLC